MKAMPEDLCFGTASYIIKQPFHACLAQDSEITMICSGPFLSDTL